MNRLEKDQQVAEIRDLLGGAQAVILTEYAGLDVANMVELRRELRKAGGRFRVLKNTLTKLATADTDLADLHPHLSGPIGVATTEEDPAALAKVLTTFAKDHPALEVKVGYLESGGMIDGGGVDALSKLPGREQLQAMLLGTLSAVPRNFVSVLAAPSRNLVGVLAARQRALGAE
jgi:large subunit ribosomal protein L10